MTFVFLHSPLVGPATWRATLAELMAAGDRGFAPALPSLGDAPVPTYAELAARVAEAIGEATGVILVAHAAAGALVPAVAEAAKGRVAGAIFVDATLPHPGRSWFNTAPPELAAGLRAMAKGGLLPPWDKWFPPGALARLVPDLAALEAFLVELEPLSLGFFEEPAPAVKFDGPSAYLQLSTAYATQAVKAHAMGWPTARLGLNHLVMLTHPAEVLSLVRTLAADLA